MTETAADPKDNVSAPVCNRILVVDFGGTSPVGEALLEALIGFRFQATLARNLADLLLKLSTWSPHVVLVEGDAVGVDLIELEDLIRRSASVGVAVTFICMRRPPAELCGWVIRRPVELTQLASVMESALESRNPRWFKSASHPLLKGQ